MRSFRQLPLSTLLALTFALAGLVPRAGAQDEAPPSDEAVPPPPSSTPEVTETPSVDPALAVPEVAPAPQLRVIVIDAATYGIDPIVGRVATDTLRRTASSLGYGVIDPAATVAAARSIRMAYPPT